MTSSHLTHHFTASLSRAARLRKAECLLFRLYRELYLAPMEDIDGSNIMLRILVSGISHMRPLPANLTGQGGKTRQH